MCQIYTSILQKWKSVHCGDYFNDNDHRMGAWQPLKPQEGEMLNYSLWVPRSNLSNNGYLANVASQSLKQTPLLGHLSSSCWVFISPGPSDGFLASILSHPEQGGLSTGCCVLEYCQLPYCFKECEQLHLLSKSPPGSLIYSDHFAVKTALWHWSFVCIAPKCCDYNECSCNIKAQNCIHFKAMRLVIHMKNTGR